MGEFLSANGIAVDVVAALVLVFVIMVRLTASERSLQPVRSAHRYLKRELTNSSDGPISGNPLDTPPSLIQRTRIRDELIESLRRTAKSMRSPEVAQLCSSIRVAALTDEGQISGNILPPQECKNVQYLHLLVAQSLEPRHEHAIVRFLIRNRWEEHRRFLSEVERYLRQFSSLIPVALDANQTHFSEVVSLATGAGVLTDLTTKKVSLSSSSIAVWHERVWFGDLPPRQPGAGSRWRRGVDDLPECLITPYEISEQIKGENNSDRAVDGKTSSFGRLGGFNGRIPVLLHAEVVRSIGIEEPTILLVTGETDYATTEPSPTPPRNALPCKKLSFQGRENPISRYRAIRRGKAVCAGSSASVMHDCQLRLQSLEWKPWNLHIPRPDRVLTTKEQCRPHQLNAKVTFLSRVEKANEITAYAMLMNRSNSNENGYGIAATTAGGALSLSVPKGYADANEFGAIDALGGLRREITEELGLCDDDYSLAVHAVVQHNSRPEPSTNTTAEGILRFDSNNGELTASCLAIAHTGLSPKSLRERRYAGSASSGLAEAEGLIGIPLRDNAADFYSAITEGYICLSCSAFWPDDKFDASTHRKNAIKRLLDNIEQMALVSLAYCSAIIHGVPATELSWGTIPLWVHPHIVDDVEYSRVCVDPGSLFEADSVPQIMNEDPHYIEYRGRYG